METNLYDSADIGLIGLAVMGQNLILNMNDNGFVVCAYNRTHAKVDHFLANEAKGKLFFICRMVMTLKSLPRLIRHQYYWRSLC